MHRTLRYVGSTHSARGVSERVHLVFTFCTRGKYEYVTIKKIAREYNCTDTGSFPSTITFLSDAEKYECEDVYARDVPDEGPSNDCQEDFLVAGIIPVFLVNPDTVVLDSVLVKILLSTRLRKNVVVYANSEHGAGFTRKELGTVVGEVYAGLSKIDADGYSATAAKYDGRPIMTEMGIGSTTLVTMDFCILNNCYVANCDT